MLSQAFPCSVCQKHRQIDYPSMRALQVGVGLFWCPPSTSIKYTLNTKCVQRPSSVVSKLFYKLHLNFAFTLLYVTLEKGLCTSSPLFPPILLGLHAAVEIIKIFFEFRETFHYKPFEAFLDCMKRQRENERIKTLKRVIIYVSFNRTTP